MHLISIRLLIKLLRFQTPLIMKSNRVICSADADFCLHKTDNLYYDDVDNKKTEMMIKKCILEQEEAQLQIKEEKVRFPQPLFNFIYDII